MKNANMVLMAAIPVLCILLFLQPVTGSIFHMIVGIALIVVTALHMKGRTKVLTRAASPVRITNWIIIISLVVLFISGLLIHAFDDVLAFSILHKLAAVAFVIGCIAHALQHRRPKKTA